MSLKANVYVTKYDGLGAMKLKSRPYSYIIKHFSDSLLAYSICYLKQVQKESVDNTFDILRSYVVEHFL